MKKFALIGRDIGYSLSPRIHKLIYQFFGLADCEYNLLDLTHGELEKNFLCLCKEYDGFNVTVPYKNIVGRFACVDKSPITAINTLKISDNNVFGYNTDIDGFGHHINKLEINPKSALIIGAGGAMEAVLHVLCGMGTKVCIKCRTSQRADELRNKGYNVDYQSFRPELIVNASGKEIFCSSFDSICKQISTKDTICNQNDNLLSGVNLPNIDTIYNQNNNLLSGVNLSNIDAVYDLSYRFSCQEEQAKRLGWRYFDGLDMLIYQAIFAAKILYGIEIDNKIEIVFEYIKKNLVAK